MTIPTVTRFGDRDLWWVAGLLWFACAVRVSFALLQHETFGAEATAAALCVGVVPWLLLRRPPRT